MNMQILNGAPWSRNLGIEDISGETPAPQPDVVPTHLPKVWGYAQKGDHTKPYLVQGASRTKLFGADSFDENSKWFNHATAFSNAFNEQGNAQMFQRIKPDNAPGPATIRLMLDLLPVAVQDYERNIDGSYKRAANNALIPLGVKTPGYMAKWIAVQVPVTEEGEDTFGVATVTAGDQPASG